MNLTRAFVSLTFCLCAVLHAEPVMVQFGGVKYELASVELGRNGAMTNEYVPQGETIDVWTTLIGVRQWPHAEVISDATKPWLKMINPLLAQKVGAYKSAKAEDGKDVIFEAWLLAPDRSFMEINLYRFLSEEGTAGIKSYQFAQRIKLTDGKGDFTAFSKNRDDLFKEISELKLPSHKTKE